MARPSPSHISLLRSGPRRCCGNSTGTYAGTFTETGRINVGPEEGPTLRQRITSAAIDFTINSPTGQVTGTKTYVPVGDPNVNVAAARCVSDWDGNRASAFAATDDIRFAATIKTTEGQTCTHSGFASLSMGTPSSVLSGYFAASFANDVTAPTPVCTGGEPEPELPASKDDCLDGGWANYGFKNQGECIAWVNHNLP
jgi:hypothetical protein